MTNKIDEIALRVAGAYEALSEIDDCARMDIGVDAMGPRKVLEQFVADVEKLADTEERVAEAIAKMIQGWSCTNGPSIASAIRSGKWKEYL